MSSEDHPWKNSLIGKSWNHGERNIACHPNSLLATAPSDLLEYIFGGMKVADEDLRVMEHWARRGFVGG